MVGRPRAAEALKRPEFIGQLITEAAPATTGGPVLWISANSLSRVLGRVEANGGKVRGRPQLDGDERWLAEIDDPAGNRLGVVVPVGPAQSQTMIAVRDVEASSRWYQRLLGLRSDHGGAEYEAGCSLAALGPATYITRCGTPPRTLPREDAEAGQRRPALVW